MKHTAGPTTAIACAACRHKNEFQQPYRYHAGFGNQGFLYNNEGNLTLTWSSFDPAYQAVVGEKHPWTLTAEEQERLEERLSEAPFGGQFRFENPAKCLSCGAPISPPMMEDIYYVRFPGSIDTEREGNGLQPYLRAG